MLLRLIHSVGLFLLLALASQNLVAEEAEQQVDSEQTDVDEAKAEVELAKKRALERKKMQIKGYQSFTVAGQEIEGTYLEEITGDKHGVIIFFHDNNQQLETPSVVTPLRQMLPLYGWSTISFAMDYPVNDNILLSTSSDESDSSTDQIALPEVEAESKKVVMADDEAVKQNKEESDDSTTSGELPPVSNEERVRTIISFIKAKDYSRIIFVGHGEGAEIAANIMAPLDTGIDALILIDADDFELYEAFEKIFKLIVDIYPEQMSDSVKQGVLKRKKITKLEEKTVYMSRVVLGANKLFYGFESRLAKVIRSILNKQFLAEND